jgi:D-psicose/D-tagatose/L-ribulose 3-epimerase
MKAGINFLLWTVHVEEEHFPLFKKLKAAGYDGVEIPLTFGDVKHYEKVRRAIEDEGLECTTTSNCSPDKNIISSDPAIRQAGLDHLKWAVDCNHALGSQIIGGPIHSAPGVFTGESATEQEKQWAIENLKAAGDYAGQAGVTLTLEFLNRFESYLMNTVAQAKEITDAVGSEFVGIHYDTHHVHYEEYDIAKAIKNGGSSIKHVHYSESNRGNPGQGLVDWETNTKALKEIGYDGWITIEAFTTKVDGLRQALHVWRPFFGSEEECYLHGIELIKKHWS